MIAEVAAGVVSAAVGAAIIGFGPGHSFVAAGRVRVEVAVVGRVNT